MNNSHGSLLSWHTRASAFNSVMRWLPTYLLRYNHSGSSSCSGYRVPSQQHQGRLFPHQQVVWWDQLTSAGNCFDCKANREQHNSSERWILRHTRANVLGSALEQELVCWGRWLTGTISFHFHFFFCVIKVLVSVWSSYKMLKSLCVKY